MSEMLQFGWGMYAVLCTIGIGAFIMILREGDPDMMGIAFASLLGPQVYGFIVAFATWGI